ncbi:MAG: DUF3822 family protein [Taibaiella sp.]|nr:DUF3822 family protein [Taibaiella sp.]
MIQLNNTANAQQVYSPAGNLNIQQISEVICGVFSNGMLSAAFGYNKELLSIRYNGADKELGPWPLAFYQQQLAGDPFLAKRELVSNIFIGTDKYMLVPEQLYDEKSAVDWLKSIHFIEATDAINVQYFSEEKANYLYAWPAEIKTLLQDNFKNAKVMPFAAYQFRKPLKAGYTLICCITDSEVYGTMYNNKTLKWHQVFPYTTAEDISYHIKSLCKHYKVASYQLVFQCSVLAAALNPLLYDLAEYFNNVIDKSAKDPVKGEWSNAVQLVQLMQSCVL